MPERYEAIKRKMIREKAPDPKGSAARIFNATRKPGEAPVTGKHKSATGGKR